jgi:itaconyl-CoA hydratase
MSDLERIVDHSSYYPAGAARWQEHWGMPFEGFAVGQRFRHRPGITLSQRDNVVEALDTFNAAMIHYDGHYSAQTAWKQELMVSTVTVQRVVGMANKTYGDRAALRGFEEIALTGPLFGGDTIYSESEVLELDGSGDGPTGLAKVEFRCVKADGGVVAKLRALLDINRRGRAPGAPHGQHDPAPRFAAYRQDADGTLTEQTGLFFEEFEDGDTFLHAPRRSFHAHEAVDYGRRAFDQDPRTQDLDWIARHAGGRMRVPETFVLGAATAPTTRSFGRVVANLGWYDISLPNPVFVGDTVRTESTVLGRRDSKSRPNEGILTVETRAFNQDGAPVVSYRRNLLVYRRNAVTPYAAAGY